MVVVPLPYRLWAFAMSHPNTKIKNLITEFRHEFGDMSGSNVPLDALLLYHFLKTMTGGGTTSNSSGGSTAVSSTVTVKGSTGSTILTNAQGAILIGSPLGTEATLSAINGKLPNLINNRLPVEAIFPSEQRVNLITGFATETTLNSLLGRIPQQISGRIPVNVQFPNTLATESTLSALLAKLPALIGDRLPVDVVFPPQQVDAQITGFSTESTLQELVSRTPELIQGKTPVVFDSQSIIKTEVTNHQTRLATEATLSELSDRIPELVEGRLPVNLLGVSTEQTLLALLAKLPNPISGYSTESTLSALLGRVPEPVQGRLPVGVVFPNNQAVTVSNQLTGVSSEATLSALLGRIPELLNSRLPVNVQFPNNQAVTVGNQISGFSTEQTLLALLARLPDLVSGRIPVGVSFPSNQNVTVSNPTSGYSTESTLASLRDRIPAPVNERLPVGVIFPAELAKDASTIANGAKLDQIVTNTSGSRLISTQSQHYTSKVGGQRTFNATAGIVAIGATATLATLFLNPVGSGVDIYICKAVLASLAAGNFMRYRGGSYTLAANATAAKSLNRSKGTKTAAGKVYGNTGVTVSGGDMAVVHFNAAHNSYPDNIDGTIILPPGDFIYWLFSATTNNATQTAIEVVWWELPVTA